MQGTVDLAIHEWPVADGRADAPVAVLVHGIAGWWRTWWRVGPLLADRGWRVIGVDQRFHGRSPDGEASDIDQLARDLEAAIQRHAGGSVDALIGHSLGAVVSQRLAWMRPDLTRRLLLEDPPGLVRHDDTEWQARMRAEAQAARDQPEAEVQRELEENPAWLKEDARQNVEGRAMWRVELSLASMRMPRGFTIPDLAAEIQVPARYVLAAPHRSVMPAEPRQRLRDNLPPGSDIVVLDGGHTLHRDRFDDYIATVLDFIG